MMSLCWRTISTMSNPFGPNAWRNASRQVPNSASLLLQKRSHWALNGLRQSGVRNVALALIRFARCE